MFGFGVGCLLFVDLYGCWVLILNGCCLRLIEWVCLVFSFWLLCWLCFCWFGLDLMLFLVGLVRLMWVCLLFARFLVFIYFIT